MLTRRALLASSVAALAVGASVGAAQTLDLSLLEVARDLARRPYVPPPGTLPAPFANLTYNAFRGIRPIVGRAAMLAQGDDFAVDLLPPGLYFPDPVAVERFVDGAWQELELSPELFDFDPRYFDTVPDTSPGAGFSGLRLRYPLNSPGVMDEVAVIQGASYFRAIGQAMAYGLSARAVALGTGEPIPEEFPRFTTLRLHQAEAGRIRLEGLIDSPSLAGYLNMTLTPGSDTKMEIDVTLIPRVTLETIGIAPLTSMYLKGPLHGAASDDFRPRVHDSDVLFIENGAGETLWRPISNPAQIQTSAFADENPSAFGLFQTARAYEDFEDTEARYEHRPSAVVRPTEPWGRGSVFLVEIPTGTEFLDNIVAFWRPEAPLEAGQEHRFAYELTWTLAPPPSAVPMMVAQSRSGREHEFEGVRRYVIDFDATAEGLVPDLSMSGDGELSGLSHFALPDGRGTRMTFLLTPGPAAQALELRLIMRAEDGGPLSPVWLHRWTRKRDGRV